jgi:chromosome segregation ATPase
MPDTRVGGGSFEAIIATLEKLTEAIDLLNQVDDQRAAQLASLEAAQAELRDDLRQLNNDVNDLELDVIDNANAISDLRNEQGAA